MRQSLIRTVLASAAALGTVLATPSVAADEPPPPFDLTLDNAASPDPDSAWLTWDDVPTDSENGLCLTLEEARNASEIAVYVDDVRWYADDTDEVIEDPEGNHRDAAPSFRFPSHYRYAIVFYHPLAISLAPDQSTTKPILGLSADQPTVISDLQGGGDLCFNVNDNLYRNNRGSFDLHVRIGAGD